MSIDALAFLTKAATQHSCESRAVVGAGRRTKNDEVRAEAGYVSAACGCLKLKIEHDSWLWLWLLLLLRPCRGCSRGNVISTPVSPPSLVVCLFSLRPNVSRALLLLQFFSSLFLLRLSPTTRCIFSPLFHFLFCTLALVASQTCFCSSCSSGSSSLPLSLQTGRPPPTAAQSNLAGYRSWILHTVQYSSFFTWLSALLALCRHRPYWSFYIHHPLLCSCQVIYFSTIHPYFGHTREQQLPGAVHLFCFCYNSVAGIGHLGRHRQPLHSTLFSRTFQRAHRSRVARDGHKRLELHRNESRRCALTVSPFLIAPSQTQS